MSIGLRRRLADLTCRILQAALPSSLQAWGRAVRGEMADIADDTQALRFALHSLCGLLPQALASHLLHGLGALTGVGTTLSKDSITMGFFEAMLRRPRATGVVCAISAVVLGLVYLAVAGAPMHYLAINVGALVIGLALLALLRRATLAGGPWTDAAMMAMAGALLATALLGEAVDGATRWIRLGGLSIQPSLILLPLMAVAFARSRSALATAGIVVAAAAMALQPDRAMAGMLAASLAALAILRPERPVVLAFGASVAGFVATLTRVDTVPAMPYVEQVLYTSFDAHALAGIAVLGGAVLLVVPAIAGWYSDAANRVTYAVFGAAWLAAIVAAALGNYPTPIVGYGGSAIIGYALSLLALPTLVKTSAGADTRSDSEADAASIDRRLRIGLA